MTRMHSGEKMIQALLDEKEARYGWKQITTRRSWKGQKNDEVMAICTYAEPMVIKVRGGTIRVPDLKLLASKWGPTTRRHIRMVMFWLSTWPDKRSIGIPSEYRRLEAY